MIDRWIVSQIGAREHYAVPRALHRREKLEHLFTDAWCRRGRSVLRQAPDPLRSLANRYHPSLPPDRVTAYTGWVIARRLRRRITEIWTEKERYQRFLEVGKEFGSRVRNHLDRHDHPSRFIFFGYDTGSKEVLEYLTGTDCFTIVNQIDPGRTHKEVVLEEAERWPGWAETLPALYEPYQYRRQEEWDLASAVVVNSEWSKQALLKQNVEEEKIYVIPLAYESPSISPSLPSVEGDLKVLWLGSVALGKGIQYLAESARKLLNAPVTFDVVGPIEITDEAVNQAPPNMTFHGRVPRDETYDWYRQADVFVLPTLSDGFAITQLEAMSHGLPVIATPNCGRVVSDQEEGYVVPPRDADALAEAIENLLNEEIRLRAMSEQARATSEQYTLDRVADQLISVVGQETNWNIDTSLSY